MARQLQSGKTPQPGKPTARRDSSASAPQTKKQIAHSRRQARQQRIIALCLVALALIIVGIVTAAVLNVTVMQQRKAVASVNGTPIRQSDLTALTNVRRTNLQSAIRNYTSQINSLDSTDETNSFLIQYYQSYVDQLNTQLASVDSSSLDELIEDALIQDKAKEVGLTVTGAEVQQSISDDLDSVFASSSTPVTTTEAVTGTEATPVPTATPVPQSAKDEYYATALKGMGVSDKEFRAIISRSLLRTKVQDLLASEVPTTGLVAHIKVIQTDTQEKADAAEQRIKSGEDLAVVATEVSSDTLTVKAGGDVPAITPDQVTSRYGQEVSDLAFSLETGATGRATSNGKYYIVLLVSKDQNGALPDDVVASNKSSALTDWLAVRKASPDVKIERFLALPTATPTG